MDLNDVNFAKGEAVRTLDPGPGQRNVFAGNVIARRKPADPLHFMGL